MGLAEQAELVVKLGLKDELSRGIATAKRELGGLQSQVNKGFNWKKIQSEAQRGATNVVNNLKKAGLIGGAALVGGLAASVKWAADFESQLNIINTVAQVTDTELAKIGEGIREMARETGASTDDLTAAYYDLVSAGVAAADAQGVLEAANTLAIGGLATTAETVDLLTTAINSYGLEASQAGEISNYFAQSIAAGKVTAAELAESFARVAPLAAASGIEIQELAAGYGQLTANGVPAAEASTLMRAAILALQKPTSALKTLQEKMNVSFKEIAEEEGLQAAYELMREGAEEYGVELIALTGRQEGMQYALQVTGDQAAKYDENLRLVQESTEGVGVATEQAAERQQGFSYQLNRLKANVKDAGITIGTELLPVLADLAEDASDFLGKPETRTQLKKFAQDLGETFRKIVRTVKDLDWDGIKTSLGIAKEFAQGLMQAFLDAPAWLKSAIITGWGLNKLTGGALGSIVGELGKGLIKGVLGINAGVVNLRAGTVVGGGAVGGGVVPVDADGSTGRSTGNMLVRSIAVAGGLFFAGISIMELINTWNRVGEEIRLTATETQNTIKTVIPNQSFDESINGLKNLIDTNDRNSQDIFKAILMQTGSGRTEVTLAFQQFAEQLNRTAQTPEERQQAITLLTQLRDQLGEKFTLTIPEGEALKVDLNPFIDALRSPFNQATATYRDYGTRLLDQQRAANSTYRDYGQRLLDQQRAAAAALREKLDRNNNGVVSMKEVVANRLGVSIDQLRGIKGHEERVAARLGISVEQLRAIKADAQATVSRLNGANDKLSALLRKRWTFNILHRGGSGTGPVRTGRHGGPQLDLGGRRATGGPVAPNSIYDVLERGIPELLRTRNHTYLLTGSQAGMVEPLRKTPVAATPALASYRGREPIPVKLAGRLPEVNVRVSARDVARELDKRAYWSKR